METGTVLNQQELFLLVKQEAENLKVHATQEELSNLSFDKLDPLNADACVYGLMKQFGINNSITLFYLLIYM